MIMTYNFHTHTARCRHATGTDRAYVERAVAAGVTEMGFSDHIPFLRADGVQSGFRVPLEEVGEYVSHLQALREEFRDRIAIHIGFECEYYRNCFDRMLRFAVEVGAEYLILGQHFCDDESNGAVHTSALQTDPSYLKQYVDTVTEGMRTGAFTYVAHPDVFRFECDDALYKKEMRRIVRASCETGVPLEINFLGIRTHRAYPTAMFWEMVGEEGAPVTFGFDAHMAQDAYDGESLVVAEKMVKKYGLNYVGKPTLRRLSAH